MTEKAVSLRPKALDSEGVGVKPDVEIAPTAEDIRQEKDVVLEAARKRLSGS